MIYLAAPFFNVTQQSLVSSLETILDNMSWPYFSPRQKQAKNRDPSNPEHAREIFDINVLGLRSCDTVLAVVDFALPQNIEMHVVKRTVHLSKEQQALCLNVLADTFVERMPINSGGVDALTGEIIEPAKRMSCQHSVIPPNFIAHHFAGPIYTPDTGVVWEVGYAYALGIPVVLFARSEKSKVNVMLSHAARGVCYGSHRLIDFLNTDIPCAGDLTGRAFNWDVLEQWKGGQ